MKKKKPPVFWRWARRVSSFAPRLSAWGSVPERELASPLAPRAFRRGTRSRIGIMVAFLLSVGVSGSEHFFSVSFLFTFFFFSKALCRRVGLGCGAGT